MLAKRWKPGCEVRDWLLSEKLDGLGTLWDGKNFYSREGNLFYVPQWFKKGLPRTPLSGELWAGRGKFQQASSIVRSQDMSDAWKRITFNVFDVPDHPGGFEERIAGAKQLVASAPYARAIRHRRCKGEADVKSELRRVEGMGGEGLVLRKPESAYVGRRVGTYLKVKTTHDAEATITGYYPGKGKHAGVIGGFYVETLPDQRVKGGIRFKLGTGLTDAERRRPPKIGTKITYSYQGTSDSGTPRFASYMRVRGNPRKSSRKRQRQLERGLFGPGPRQVAPRRARTRTALSDARRYGPPGIPGDCWACGNVCGPVREWQCPACRVVYQPASQPAPRGR